MRFFPFLFILLSTAYGQEFLTTETVVSCLDSSNFVMVTHGGEQSVVFKHDYKLTSPTTISTQYKADADLYLSNGIRVHLPEESSVTINLAEQDVIKNENCSIQLTGDGIGMVFNVNIDSGRADFLLSTTPTDVCQVIVLTKHAELEVHAKQFTVVVSSYDLTRVRCIDGYLIVTTIHNKSERIENEEVSIVSRELGVNAVVLRTLTSIQLYGWQSRKLPTVKWNETELIFSEFRTEP